MTINGLAGALIKGGTVVDGTGGPAYVADVRVAEGRIAEIGVDLAPGGERIFDASGCYVTPGFIDTHTHYDAAICWDPSCDPITQHGVTTVLIGNCSLGLAPVRKEDIATVSAVFSYVEDLPREAFENAVPWNWETFPQYAAVMRSRPYGVNIAALVSHSLMRQYAIGEDAWRRSATAQERAAISEHVDQAMQAGAFGVSTSRFDRSPAGAHVPSYFADDEELGSMFRAVAEHDGIVQVIPDLTTLDAQEDDLRRYGRLSRDFEVPIISNGIFQRPDDPNYSPHLLAVAREMQQAGTDFHFLASPRSIELLVNFHQCMVFLYVPAWNEVVQSSMPDERKRALLADPSWRARARTDWDSVKESFPANGVERLFRIVKVGRPDYEHYVGQTFDRILDERGQHPSDTLADWGLENHLQAEFVYPFTNTDLDQVGQLLAGKESIISGSDAGAHIGMFDGAGDTTLVLTRHVRDRNDLTLEEAVRRMTLEQARLLRLGDRGIIALGAVADLAVFDLTALQWSREQRVRDVPIGNQRFRRANTGFRYTFIGGVAVQQAGASTGDLPGTFLGAAHRGVRDMVAASVRSTPAIAAGR